MSKKIKLLLVATLVSFSFVGCNGQTDKEGENENSPQGQVTNEMNVASESDPGESMNQVAGESELLAIIERGAKAKCEYRINQDGNETNVTMFIEGERFRADTDIAGTQASSVFDGETFYGWTRGETNQGTKMTKSCLEQIQAGTGEADGVEAEKQFESVDDIVRQESEVDMSCQEVDEVNFEIPTDIEFTDTCKLLEGIQIQTQNEVRNEVQTQVQGGDQIQLSPEDEAKIQKQIEEMRSRFGN